MPAAAVPLIAGAAAGAGAYAAVTAVTVGMALSIGTAVATATMMLTTKKHGGLGCVTKAIIAGGIFQQHQQNEKLEQGTPTENRRRSQSHWT